MTKTTACVEKHITNKDLKHAWWRWWVFAEASHSFERLMGLAFCYAMIPVLQKLYTEKQELQDALRRHLQFFNTQAIWGGGFILGATIALEEENASLPAEERNPEIITTTKIGLMGPLAGIGDSIDWGTIRAMLLALAIPWAVQGSWIGGFMPITVFIVISVIYGQYFMHKSYNLGRGAAAKFLQSSSTANLIEGASVLVMLMMGVLAANYVKIVPALKWSINGKEWELAGILDQILPGILPFTVIGLIYLYFDRKGLRVQRVLLYIIIIAFLMGLLGVI
ncbi:MAG: PTS system mannose/fructose/sorbose family transporter subunit IID [Clostridium sp.]|nr:PTS system mannose/fructose/sorbose family transporter subunit IID [Clostridium sp.]